MKNPAPSQRPRPKASHMAATGSSTPTLNPHAYWAVEKLIRLDRVESAGNTEVIAWYTDCTVASKSIAPLASSKTVVSRNRKPSTLTTVSTPSGPVTRYCDVDC